jgi:hypothetical protein
MNSEQIRNDLKTFNAKKWDEKSLFECDEFGVQSLYGLHPDVSEQRIKELYSRILCLT